MAPFGGSRGPSVSCLSASGSCSRPLACGPVPHRPTRSLQAARPSPLSPSFLLHSYGPLRWHWAQPGNLPFVRSTAWRPSFSLVTQRNTFIGSGSRAVNTARAVRRPSVGSATEARTRLWPWPRGAGEFEAPGAAGCSVLARGLCGPVLRLCVRSPVWRRSSVGRGGSSGQVSVLVWPGSLAGGTHSHVCECSRHHPRKGKEAGDGYRGMLNGLRVAELQAKCVFGRSPPPCFSVGSSSVGSELLDVQCPPKGCASPAVNSRPKEPTWEGGT